MIREALSKHRRLSLAVLAGIVLLLAWGGLDRLSRSEWLAGRIGEAMVGEIERATGSSVSVESVRPGDSRLAFEAIGLEISNPSAAGGLPLLEVPQASFEITWGALLGRRSLAALRLRDPVVRVRFGEGGTSSIPWPDPAGDLPALRVQHFELSGGTLVWNGQPFDAELSGSGLSVNAGFDPALGQYSVEAGLDNPRWGVAGRPAPPAARVSVSAAIRRDEIEFRDVSLRGEDFALEGRGIARDLTRPRFEGRFTATGAIEPLAAWLHEKIPSLRGTLHAEGVMEWEAATGRLSYSGTATATGVSSEWLEADASFETRFAGSESDLNLSPILGRALGGELAGRLAVSGLGADVGLDASLTATGFAMESLVAAARVQAVPWSGVLDFGIEASGSLAESWTATATVDVRPTGGPANLPVEGNAVLSFASADRSLRVERMEFKTPHASAAVTGSVDRQLAVDLDVEASLESLQAAERLLAAVQPNAAFPDRTPAGRYSFRGNLHGHLGRVPETVLEGEFSIDDVVVGGQRWDRFEARGELSPGRFDLRQGRLADGDGALALSGTLPMQEDGELRLRAEGGGLEASKLAAAAGWSVPLEGSLSLQLEVGGTLEAPEATGRVEIAEPALLAERFDRFEADISYGPDGAALRNAVLARGGSAVHLAGSTDAAGRSLSLEARSDPWQLADFGWVSVLAPGLEGSAQFDLRATGNLGEREGLAQSFEIEGSWEAVGLQRDGSPLGDWRGRLRSARDGGIALDWRGEAFGGSLKGQAVLGRDRAWAYSGSADFRDFSVEGIPEFLGLPDLAAETAIDGSVEFDGAAGVADSFQARGTLERVEVSVPVSEDESYTVSNVFPLRWNIERGMLLLDSMSLGGAGANFEIDGSVAVGGERELDIGLDGTVDLALLQGLSGGLETSGRLGVGLRVRGTADAPVLDGTLEILGATAGAPGQPFALRDVRGEIEFREGQGRFEGITAAYGGGSVTFDGALSYADSGAEFRIQMTAEDVRIDFPESVSSAVDGRFTLAGASGRGILNGDAQISRVSIRDDVTFADLFENLHPSAGTGLDIPMLDGMQLNVHIGAVSQLPIETSLVRNVEAEFDLELVGTVDQPAMLGTIGIGQGEVRMLGTHYRIQRGEVRFSNPLQTEPVLDVELETRIRDVDIALVLSGPGRSLNLSYRSDPPLPFHELVGLVAVGKAPTIDPSLATQRRIEQHSLVQTGADNLLSQAISNPVSQRLQRFFGVSRLKVDPQIGGVEANPSARISTEQQLADDITLIYSYDLSSAQQQAIRIEWNPDRKWSFIVTRDQNGLVGSDVLYNVRLP